MRSKTFTSTKTDIVDFAGAVIWRMFQHNGNFWMFKYTDGAVARVFEDGTLLRSHNLYLWWARALRGDSLNNLVAFEQISEDWFRMDPVTGGSLELVITDLPLLSLGDSGGIWLEKKKRVLTIDSVGEVRAFTIASDKSASGPVSFGKIDGGSSSGWTQFVSYSESVLAIYNSTTGRLLFFDKDLLVSGANTQAAQIRNSSIGTGYNGVAFSLHNKVWWAIDIISSTLAFVIIWADVVQPDTLAAPTFLDLNVPASNLLTDQGSRLRTRVTSSVPSPAADENVKDWIVNWSNTGLGTLEKTQSKTDKDGYAFNYLFGPIVDPGAPTASTVKVTIQD